MKKIIIKVLLFVILISSSYAFVNVKSSNIALNEAKIEYNECKYGQCYATAESTGNRCKHCVSNEGDSYCWQHE